NKKNIYVYLNKHPYSVAALIDMLDTLDSDKNISTDVLKNYLSDGYEIGLQDEVLDFLDYAHELVSERGFTDKKELIEIIDQMIEQIMNGKLTVSEDFINRSYLPLQRINKRIVVLSKALFKSDVIFDKKIRVHGKARFYKKAHF